MPTYEYECKSCRHRFERLQSITARASTPCPRCKRSARRLISAGAGFLFKGSGFYATDYRSSSYKKKAKSEGTPNKSADKSTSDSSACGSDKGSCAKPQCKK